jgi:hypothetical protein
MELDEKKMEALGIKYGGGLVHAGTVMRYVVGVVMRERERLARVFEDNDMPDVAKAVQDSSYDDIVFKWAGPKSGLDVPASSAQE